MKHIIVCNQKKDRDQMKASSHNKKRNVGLLYEFLVATISRSLVTGDEKLSSQALKILRRHFKPGRELYKEFRLINALQKTTVSSEHVAANIIQEAKNASRLHNVKELDRQKSLLIKDINYVINDGNFYDQHVADYRSLATIQTLINDWRSPLADLTRIATYEDQLIKHLTTEKSQEPEQMLSENTPGEARLLMKVMMKKLNEKYSGVLNDEQKSLIRAYAFSTANDDFASMKLKLSDVRGSLLSSMQSYETAYPDNEYVNKKLTEAREMLLTEDVENVDDAMVTRFMLYVKLASELNSEEG